MLMFYYQTGLVLDSPPPTEHHMSTCGFSWKSNEANPVDKFKTLEASTNHSDKFDCAIQFARGAINLLKEEQYKSNDSNNNTGRLKQARNSQPSGADVPSRKINAFPL